METLEQAEEPIDSFATVTGNPTRSIWVLMTMGVGAGAVAVYYLAKLDANAFTFALVLAALFLGLAAYGKKYVEDDRKYTLTASALIVRSFGRETEYALSDILAIEHTNWMEGRYQVRMRNGLAYWFDVEEGRGGSFVKSLSKQSGVPIK